MRAFLLSALATLGIGATVVATSIGPVDAGSVARVPKNATPLQPLFTARFAPDGYGADLVPGPDHEAEGPPAIAAGNGEVAVLDARRALVRIYDEAGAPKRVIKLDALPDAAAALDLALDDRGGAAVLIGRDAGSVALIDGSGAVAARAGIDPSRSPATSLAFEGSALFVGFGDVRAWQPLRPLEPLRRGLPTPGGDCNGALLADGRAVARCHSASGLRELWIEPDPEGAPIAAVEAVHADAEGGLAAAVALRTGAGVLRRLAVRADAAGRQAWADLGPDAPWFVARPLAFARDGSIVRLTGDAAGPRVMRGALR